MAARARAGERTALMIVVQRGDAERFSPADHIDPEWGRRLRAALDQGMEIWIYRAELTLETVSLGPGLPLAL